MTTKVTIKLEGAGGAKISGGSIPKNSPLEISPGGEATFYLYGDPVTIEETVPAAVGAGG